MMPPAYVKPYVKRGKNDGRDSEGICEAVGRPTMRFVLVKSDDGAEAWRTLQDHYADFKTSLGPHDLHSLLALMEIEWPDLVGAHHGRLRAFVESDATYYAF